MQTAGPSQWQFGFCGCCEDMGTCCGILLTRAGMEGLAVEATFPSLNTGEEGRSCCVAGLLTYIYLGCLNRVYIREKNRIEGSFIGDCLAYCCCPLCASTQMVREAQARVYRQATSDMAGLGVGAVPVHFGRPIKGLAQATGMPRQMK